MISLVSKGRWNGLILLGLNGLVQSLSLLYLLTQLRDHILKQQGSLPEQWFLLLLLVAILTATRFIEKSGSESLALRYVHRVRNDIFQHFLRLPPQSAKRINRGGLLMRLTGDLGAIKTWITLGLVPTMTLGIWLSVAVIALTWMDPVLVAIVLIMLVLALPVYWLGGRALYLSSGNVRQQRARLISFTTERITGVPLIMSTNQTGRETRRFSQLSERLLLQQRRRARWIGVLRALTEMTSLLLIGTLALVGHYRIDNGPLTTDQFVMITVFSLYLLPQLRRLGRVYEYWTQYRLARHKLNRFLARKPAPVDGKSLKLGIGKPVDISVELPHMPPFKAQAGANIMLVDAHKTVSSTLGQLLNGSSPPHTVANILVNDTSVDTLSASERKRRIVIINSNIQLWNGTLKYNLTYGMRRSNEEELQQVLAICGLAPLVDRLADGLDTRLMPHAHPLSDQECFAIQLCRALLRKPSLMLVDHPITSQSLSHNALVADVAEYFQGTLIVTTENAAEMPSWIDTFWNTSRLDIPLEHLRETVPNA